MQLSGLQHLREPIQHNPAMVVDLLTFLQVCCQSAVCLDLSFRRWKTQQALDFLFPSKVEVLGQIGRYVGQGCFGTVYELRRLEHSCTHSVLEPH